MKCTHPNKHNTMQQIWALGWWSDIVVVLISALHVGQDIFTGFGPKVYAITCWCITRTSGCGAGFCSVLKRACDVDWLEFWYIDEDGIVVWFCDWLSEILLYTKLFFWLMKLNVQLVYFIRLFLNYALMFIISIIKYLFYALFIK